MPSQEELLLRDAEDIASTCTDIDEADQWASAIQSVFRRIGFDPAPNVTVPDVLKAAAARGGAAGAVLAAALATYGPLPGRHEAGRLYRRLVTGGVVVPEWVESLGDVTPLRAMKLTDAWGDECRVWIDFVRPDAAVRGLHVKIDRIWGGTAYGFAHGATIDTLAAKVKHDPHTVVEEIGLADARAMIDAGLQERDAMVGLDDDEGYDEFEAFDEDLRALVDQRIGLLPLGGDAALPRPLSDEEVAEIAAGFVEWPHEQDRDAAEVLAATISWFVSYCYDGDPLHWSPGRIAGFVAGWTSDMVTAGDEWFAMLESVFPSWLDYAAERRELDADLLEVNRSVARETFAARRRIAAGRSDWSTTGRIVKDVRSDGIDRSDPDSQAAVQAWIDRYNAHPHRERH